jgi:(R,R)-butanediol dehydrogenase/meso-butanediol dehydrogenase/diacetyl reductase
MKALQLHGHKDIRVEDVPEPRPPPGWSVVRVAWSSICHSDVREYLGPSYIGRTGEPNAITGVYLPVILGHEFAGTVVEMNGGHPSIKLGDHVAPDGCIYDGTCWYCRNGRYNLCEQLAVLGFDAHGSHAEYVAVPNYSLNALPEGVGDEEGALIEPLAVAVHGVRRARVGVGDTVAIAGAGMIGLCTLLVARASGASHVFVSEPLKGRRERAARLGATVLDPDAGDVGEQVHDLTGGRGADIAIDCVGVEPSLNSALRMTRRGGRVVLVGIFTKDPTIEIGRIGLDERELTGALAYAYDFPRAIALVADGRVDLRELVSDRIPLRDVVTRGFERMDAEANELVRILVDTQAV